MFPVFGNEMEPAGNSDGQRAKRGDFFGLSAKNACPMTVWIVETNIERGLLSAEGSAMPW